MALTKIIQRQRPNRLSSVLLLLVSLSVLGILFRSRFFSKTSSNSNSNSNSIPVLPPFCYDPYRLPGHPSSPDPALTRSPSEATWAVDNPAPRYRGRGSSPPIRRDFPVHSLLADLVNGAQPSWLQNRTVIFIGDSLDRNLVHFLASEAFPGPSSHRFLNSHTHPAFAEPATASHQIGFAQHRPLGLTLVNWFLMGVDVETRSDFFHPGEDEPQKIEDRIPHFFLPLLGPLISPTPDLVVFNAGLWDLVYRSEAAADAARRKVSPPRIVGGPLTPQELTDHETRMSTLISILDKAFPHPQTRMVYRTMPDSAIQADDNAMSRLRIRQLDNAHVKLIHHMNGQPDARPIDIIDWARISRGLSYELADLVHYKPGKAQWLYGDLVLNHLRRLVLGDGPETEWVDCQAYLESSPAISTSLLGSSRSVFQSQWLP